jgi:hypothetical protein
MCATDTGSHTPLNDVGRRAVTASVSTAQMAAGSALIAEDA